MSLRRVAAFTLVELTVVMALIGAVAAFVVVPAAGAHGRLSASTAAGQFALVLREAQARAQTSGCRVQVTVTGGARYTVAEAAPGGPIEISAGTLGPARCSTNYPGGGVVFAPAGWPCSITSGAARAGSFVFAWGASSGTVVVQMGGCVRCR